MFLKAAAAAVLAMSMASADINSNDVDTRFFIGLFNLNEFPLAIDQCSPFDILGTLYQKATCRDDDSVKWVWYTSSDCTTGTEYQSENFNASTGFGFYGDYNCDASSDSYATVQFTTTECCETGVSFVEMNAAVDTCTFVGIASDEDQEDYTSISVYCKDDSYVELQYYDASAVPVATCGSETLLTQIANTTDVCEEMLTTEAPDGSDTVVYGYITKCVIEDTEVNNADGVSSTHLECTVEDSATTLSMAGLLVVSVIAAFRL